MKKGQRPSRHIRKVRVGKYKLVCRRVLINPSIKRKPRKKVIRRYTKRIKKPVEKKRIIVKEEIIEKKEEETTPPAKLYFVKQKTERLRKEPEDRIILYPRYVPIPLEKGVRRSSVYTMKSRPGDVKTIKAKNISLEDFRPAYKRTRVVYIPYQKEWAKRWKIEKTDEPAKRYKPETLTTIRSRKRNILERDLANYIRVQSKKKEKRGPSVSTINRAEGFVTLEALKRKINKQYPKAETVKPVEPQTYPYPRPISKKKIVNIIDEVKA